MVTGQGGIPGQMFACLELKNEASLHAYSTPHSAFLRTHSLNVEEAIVDAITVDVDECDSCTDAHAQAYLYAEMPSGHTLSYCGNHGTRYLDGLIRQGAKIIDLRHLIEP